MKPIQYATLTLLLFSQLPLLAGSAPAHLPGELSTEAILNGAYPYPPSPAFEVEPDFTGFAQQRLSPVPAPGIHPRILFSPADLPDIRRRLRETETGRELYGGLLDRLNGSIRNPEDWRSEFYDCLANGDLAAAKDLIQVHDGFPPGLGHYKPFLFAVVLEAFDALIHEDMLRGKRAATAIATWAELSRPAIDAASEGAMSDDVFRAMRTGVSDQSIREGVGGHLLGYAYDFAHGFMTEAQRDVVRQLIADATFGRLWMGARLPHHFRNWNWVAIGLQQPLLALAIEGEEGFDPRVYRLGVEIAKDFLTYGMSPAGISTEAVGYTQFGLVWGNPFFVAAARRGDNLFVHPHHRAMIDWYLQTLVPSRERWTSFGDGGDGAPSVETLSMWRHFYPDDPKVEYLWQARLNLQKRIHTGDVRADRRIHRVLRGDLHLILPLIFADGSLPTEDSSRLDRQAQALQAPATIHDPHRGWLASRSGWDADATYLQFQARTDSHTAGHEHADVGAFTFAALGRFWAKDFFRSVETRHHNSILIDGHGQGFWPGPAEWLEFREEGPFLIAAVDVKPCYNWFWPKQILTEDPDSFVRFQFPRWKAFQEHAQDFQSKVDLATGERDTRPAVLASWQGFEEGDPRFWDEDAWPLRFPHNPVQLAFRTVVFNRGPHPYLIIMDDIQKDESERLYEWLMHPGNNTALVSLVTNDIILADATLPRDENGLVIPRAGDRQLLVRILDMNNPADPMDYTSRPTIRLEHFERKDSFAPDGGSGFQSSFRTFGIEKRLVIPSRSVSPDFKILLFPHRVGDSLPETAWNEDRTVLTLRIGKQVDVLQFCKADNGRTQVKFRSTTN